jgi:multiple sugar transport system ATP-binding protein
VPALELRSLTKVYPGGVAGVTEISLSVEPGELITLVGPSGSGKSTLLRLVAGLETPSSGEVVLAGRSAHDVPPSDREIAMVFQHHATYPHLNVAENLAFGLKARRIATTEIRSRVHEMAEVLGLQSLLKRKPATLSGGERQRVALGRALVRRPRFLLLDEPFSSLDAPLRVELRAELRRLHRQFSTTTLHVTHDQDEALALGDRVAVLDRGRIVQVGAPDAVYDHPATRTVAAFLGNPPMNLVAVHEITRDAEGTRILLGDKRASVPVEDRVLPSSTGANRRSLVLGFRPERARLNRTSDTSARSPCAVRVAAHVRAVEPTGRDHIVQCDLGGSLVDVLAPRKVVFELGAAVDIEIELAAVRWFDSASGRAIEM